MAYINGNEVLFSGNIDVSLVSAEELEEVTTGEDWKTLAFHEHEGEVINSVRAVMTYATGTWAAVDVTNYLKLKVTGMQYQSQYNYALCAFYNAAGTLVSRVTLSDSTRYTDYEIDVPETAVVMFVTGAMSHRIKVTGLKRLDVQRIASEKANKVEQAEVLTGVLTEGIALKVNGGTYENASANHLTVDLPNNVRRVLVHGYQWVFAGYAVAMFCDADGNIISVHKGETELKGTSLVIDVPHDAKTLIVNGNTLFKQSPAVEGISYIDLEDVYHMCESLPKAGKKLITLGDSITALGTGATGWVRYFIEKTGCTLVANVAVNSAVLPDKAGTVYDGNPVWNGADSNVNNVLGNQVQKIINNAYEAPDIIMVAIGTNGGINITQEQIKAAYYDSNNALVPLENVDRTTSAGAYRWCLEKLHETYPNALIFWCTPIMGYQTVRSAGFAMQCAESLRIATEYTGQMMIDTIRCGINGVNEVNGGNGEYLVDGLHPNANGAKKIGYYNASKVAPFLN